MWLISLYTVNNTLYSSSIFYLIEVIQYLPPGFSSHFLESPIVESFYHQLKDILLLKVPYIHPTTPYIKNRYPVLLGVAGYLCLWISNCAFLAQPLYQATQEDLSESLELKSNICSAFNTLKQAILSSPALTLPNRPFLPPYTLHCWETQNCSRSFGTKIRAPSSPLSLISQSN